MLRIVLFLLLIALAAAGAAWVAEQPGEVALSFGGPRYILSMPIFALCLGIVIVAALVVLFILGLLWRTPRHIRRRRHERRLARGRLAITHGLLAIGHGDPAAASQHAETARRHASDDPLTLLLHAQSAQLAGDRDGAKAVFNKMAQREDTRLLGLRGLFIEAQRADDAVAAALIAEEALKLSPASTWASHAVLGFRCAQGDWDGALKILDNDLAAGLTDKPAWRRRRGVLLTARALELEKVDRDRSRDSVMEAVKLAPTLVPAAALAAKFESEAHQVRRAMRIVEAAWLAHPHPDLADAYAHVRLGDSARQRLVRVETLAAKTPDHVEGKLAIARAAIDASEFARAREALASLVADPTQRVAMLMAEIERIEHGDSGKARMWTLRAVRARHDPAWTADGYVSDRWRPVSPVTGRLDAFQWQTPVASLPSSDKDSAIESSSFEEEMLTMPPPRRQIVASEGLAEPPRDSEHSLNSAPVNPPPVSDAPDQTSAEEAAESIPPAEAAAGVAAASAPASSPPAEPQGASAPTPLFRNRVDLSKPAAPIAPVIPIVRAPDDPGIDDESPTDEFVEQIGAPKAQAGGWRGFLARWGG
jgi:HemY protein